MNDDIDFKHIFWQFIVRLSFVIVMVIILYFCGNTEIIRWFTSYETRDLGSFIMLIGMLMGVACFFDTTQPFFSIKPFNLVCSSSIWIFGYNLYNSGMATAIFSLGVISLIIAYLSAPISSKVAGISFITGILFLFIGWLPIPNLPTKIHPQTNKPVDIITEWRITLVDSNYNLEELHTYELSSQIRDLKHPLIPSYTLYTIGTEESITRNAQTLLKKYIDINPNKNLDSIKIRCINLPQSYTDQYGFPEIYFYEKHVYIDGRTLMAKIY